MEGPTKGIFSPLRVSATFEVNTIPSFVLSFFLEFFVDRWAPPALKESVARLTQLGQKIEVFNQESCQDVMRTP